MKINFFYFTALYCAVFFYFNNGIAQSGKIQYNNNATISTHFNEIKSRSQLEYSKFEEIAIYERNVKRKIKYELKFNENSSLFQPIRNQDLEDEVKIGIQAEGIFYRDSNSNICFITRRFKNFEVHLLPVDWEITDEIKNILGYNCKKAIGYKIVDKNNRLSKTKIEAWFSEDIKLAYGPLGIGGLPGVILQLDFGSYHFYATSIELDNNIEVKKPKIESETIFEVKFSKIMKTTNN